MKATEVFRSGKRVKPMPSSDEELKEFEEKCREIGIPLEPHVGYPKPKIVSFVKGDKYWLNRYYIECLVCGNTSYRARVDSRTSPLCGKCHNKLERIKQSKRTERKQKLHDAKVRNKAIDDFANALCEGSKQQIELDEGVMCVPLYCKAQFCEGNCNDCVAEIRKIAEQLKGVKTD